MREEEDGESEEGAGLLGNGVSCALHTTWEATTPLTCPRGAALSLSSWSAMCCKGQKMRVSSCPLESPPPSSTPISLRELSQLVYGSLTLELGSSGFTQQTLSPQTLTIL